MRSGTPRPTIRPPSRAAAPRRAVARFALALAAWLGLSGVTQAQYATWDSTNPAVFATSVNDSQPAEWASYGGDASAGGWDYYGTDGVYPASYEVIPGYYDVGLVHAASATTYEAAVGYDPSYSYAEPAAADYGGYGLSQADYSGHAFTSQTGYESSGWSAPVESWSQPDSTSYWPASQPPAVGDGESEYRWIVLPGGLLYRSYIAGIKESRFQAVWLWEKDRGLIWETTLGGRMGIFRYGTPDRVFGEGFQLDMEGAAFSRVDPTLPSAPLEAADFRFGLVGTWRRGPWATKFGYYHLSSHAGDEYMINNPTFVRVNYVRDSLLAGVSYNPTVDTRLYAEVGYAAGHEEGAEPLEFQFGAEYAPYECDPCRGAPFAAINGHFRQDFGWIGSVNFITGWQWRGSESKRALRLGMQVYSGPSLQYEFLDRYERLAGLGIWYDY
jgi:hypothetical protein